MSSIPRTHFRGGEARHDDAIYAPVTPVLGKQEQGVLGAQWTARLFGKSPANARPCFKRKKKQCLRNNTDVVLWPVHTHTCTHRDTHVREKGREGETVSSVL